MHFLTLLPNRKIFPMSANSLAFSNIRNQVNHYFSRNMISLFS